jgi:drug/metabolite transporter (DMT)-like permease
MTDQPTQKDWLSIGILGLIWGSSFMFVSVALEGFGPLTTAAIRTTLAAATLLILTRYLRIEPPFRQPNIWRFVIPIGITATALPFFLLTWGQQYVPSAFAGLSMAAVPLFVVPIAHIFSDEKMSTQNTIGVILGFTGAAVLLGPGVFKAGTGDLEPLARLACLAAALSYAVASVTTRRCPPIHPVALAAMALIVGSVTLIPPMLTFEGVPEWSGNRPGLAVIYLGLLPTALATLLQVQVIRRAGSIFLSLVNYQVPVWSMVFGAWILSEALPLRFFAALVLILTGLAISQRGALKKVFGR